MAKYEEVPVLLWMDDLTNACTSAKCSSHRALLVDGFFIEFDLPELFHQGPLAKRVL